MLPGLEDVLTCGYQLAHQPRNGRWRLLAPAGFPIWLLGSLRPCTVTMSLNGRDSVGRAHDVMGDRRLGKRSANACGVRQPKHVEFDIVLGECHLESPSARPRRDFVGYCGRLVIHKRGGEPLPIDVARPLWRFCLLPLADGVARHAKDLSEARL